MIYILLYVACGQYSSCEPIRWKLYPVSPESFKEACVEYVKPLEKGLYEKRLFEVLPQPGSLFKITSVEDKCK